MSDAMLLFIFGATAAAMGFVAALWLLVTDNGSLEEDEELIAGFYGK